MGEPQEAWEEEPVRVLLPTDLVKLQAITELPPSFWEKMSDPLYTLDSLAVCKLHPSSAEFFYPFMCASGKAYKRSGWIV